MSMQTPDEMFSPMHGYAYYYIYILIQIEKKLNAFWGLILSNQNRETCGKPTLSQVLLVFVTLRVSGTCHYVG